MSCSRKLAIKFKDTVDAIRFITEVHKKITTSDLLITLKNNNVEVKMYEKSNEKKVINTLYKIKKEMNKDGTKDF